VRAQGASRLPGTTPTARLECSKRLLCARRQQIAVRQRALARSDAARKSPRQSRLGAGPGAVRRDLRVTSSGTANSGQARSRPEEERRTVSPTDGMAISLLAPSLERFAKLGSFCRIICFCQSGCCATLYSQVYSRFGAALGRPCAIERFPAPVRSMPCALTGSAPPSPLCAPSPFMPSGIRRQVCIITAPGQAYARAGIGRMAVVCPRPPSPTARRALIPGVPRQARRVPRDSPLRQRWGLPADIAATPIACTRIIFSIAPGTRPRPMRSYHIRAQARGRVCRSRRPVKRECA
jgi:hypothetical protein